MIVLQITDEYHAFCALLRQTGKVTTDRMTGLRHGFTPRTGFGEKLGNSPGATKRVLRSSARQKCDHFLKNYLERSRKSVPA